MAEIRFAGALEWDTCCFVCLIANNFAAQMVREGKKLAVTTHLMRGTRGSFAEDTSARFNFEMHAVK